jgi:hypothetical protein
LLHSGNMSVTEALGRRERVQVPAAELVAA